MLRYDVAAQSVLAGADRPNVQVMEFLHVIHLNDIVLKLLNINLRWGTFHEDDDTILEDWDRGEANDHREQVGADRIGKSPGRPEIDDDSCCDDSDAHQKISKHVQIGTGHVYVLMSLRSRWLLVLRKKGLGEIIAIVLLVVAMFMIVVVVSNFGCRVVTMSSILIFHVQDLHLNDVEAEAKDGNDKHDASKHGLWCDDPQSSLIDKPDCQAPNEDDAHYGADDL